MAGFVEFTLFYNVFMVRLYSWHVFNGYPMVALWTPSRPSEQSQNNLQKTLSIRWVSKSSQTITQVCDLLLLSILTQFPEILSFPPNLRSISVVPDFFSSSSIMRQKLFEEQLKKYDQIKVYLEQNLAAQENILKALTDANVKYAAVRKTLSEVEHK